eukprot:1761896-Amphidinium_carterae.1
MPVPVASEGKGGSGAGLDACSLRTLAALAASISGVGGCPKGSVAGPSPLKLTSSGVGLGDLRLLPRPWRPRSAVPVWACGLAITAASSETAIGRCAKRCMRPSSMCLWAITPYVIAPTQMLGGRIAPQMHRWVRQVQALVVGPCHGMALTFVLSSRLARAFCPTCLAPVSGFFGSAWLPGTILWREESGLRARWRLRSLSVLPCVRHRVSCKGQWWLSLLGSGRGCTSLGGASRLFPGGRGCVTSCCRGLTDRRLLWQAVGPDNLSDLVTEQLKLLFRLRSE